MVPEPDRERNGVLDVLYAYLRGEFGRDEVPERFARFGPKRTPTGITDVVRSYLHAEITRAEMIETLATWPYKEPSDVELERHMTEAERYWWIHDGGRDIFEAGTHGELLQLETSGIVSRDDRADITLRIMELSNDPRLEHERYAREHPRSWPAPPDPRKSLPPTVITEWVHAYRDGELSYDELKARILAHAFKRLPYPLWADNADLAPYGYKPVPGTWEEFIAFYDDGTLSHDDWWGIAGEHPDWAGAPHEMPDTCDPVEGYIVSLREPVMTEKGLRLAESTTRTLYLTEHIPPTAE